uniref:Uncharacterized protein n=1 Tax=Arundo donax TaxID=35708 RepID=A0A0A9D295_ARUDO
MFIFFSLQSDTAYKHNVYLITTSLDKKNKHSNQNQIKHDAYRGSTKVQLKFANPSHQ